MFNLLVDKWLNSPPINLSPSRCVRSRFKRSSCQKCIGHCPQRAISFQGQIKIDKNKCNGCGICVNLCPTGVFELKDISYIQLFNIIENRGTIVISCEKTFAGFGVKVPCLGFLCTSFLVSLIMAGGKSIFIDNSECQGCSNKIAIKVISETVENTNTLVDMLGLKADIIFPGDAFNNQYELPYSRREILSLFRRQAKYKVSEMLHVADQQRHEDIFKEQRIPEHRKLLLDFWPRLPGRIQSQNSCLLFAEIKVNSNCNLCTVCVKACPTGSLKRFEDDRKVVLKHEIDYCVKCGLCAEICPQGALEHSDTIGLSNFNRRMPKDLIVLPKETCNECGKDFIVTKDSLLCNSCSSKKQLSEEFFANLN